MEVRLLDDTKERLVYALYVPDDINDIYEDESLRYHLACMENSVRYEISFTEIIFVIHTNNTNTNLIEALKIKLSSIFIMMPNITFILESNAWYAREGAIFRKYVLEKLEEYDGITMFFHNKSIYKNDDPSYDARLWIAGQYCFVFSATKYFLGSFIESDKIVYGWPYLHDSFHQQHLIGGACYWLKCQELYNYIQQSGKKPNMGIDERSCAEFFIIKELPSTYFDYPRSNILKEYFILDNNVYPHLTNDKIHHYLQNTMTYQMYAALMKFYNEILDLVENS